MMEQQTSKNFFHQLFGFVIENFGDFILLVGAVILLIISNTAELEDKDLLLLIISLLGLMIGSDLVFRYFKMRKIEKNIKEMNESLDGIVNNVLSSQKIERIYNDIENANKVWMIGNCLRSSIFYMFDGLIEAIERGLDLITIVMDFRNLDGIKTLCNMYPGSKNEVTSKQTHEYCTRRIFRIAASSLIETKGSIRIGLFPSILRYGMIIIDPEIPRGKIYLKIYKLTQCSFQPVVVIEKEKNPEWFDFFYDQAKNIWKICQEKGEVFEEKSYDRLGELLKLYIDERE